MHRVRSCENDVPSACLIHPQLCTCAYTVWPKIFKVEKFREFHGSDDGREKFLPRNFKFITDARRDWNLDYENFIHENLFLSRI